MEQKTVYCYDSETGEFTFSDIAFEDELNPGTFLLPPDCTEVAPYPPKGTAAVWNGESWDYVQDHRGERYWLPDAKYGDAPLTMTGLGAFPEDALFEMPQPELDVAKQMKLQEINSVCDAILNQAVASYPQSEILTFDQQVEEVKAYQQTGNPASAPLLSALAGARGISLDELCLRVITKRAQFSTLSGIIIGQRQHLEDVLDTLETVEEVQALEVDIGIPTQAPPDEDPPDTGESEEEAAGNSGFSVDGGE
jgi:hypothetical protein